MIRELRTLIAVARHGTFASAGQRLGLTQSAVSGHIRRLEDSFGFPLFERTARSARLNAAGARTLERAEELVAAFDAIGEPSRDRKADVLLRVGAIASVQATIVTRALLPFHAMHPSCRFNLVPGVSLQLVDRVDAGELDIAIVVRPTFDLPPNLAWVPLVTEEYALLVPADVDGDQDWRALISTLPFIRYDRASFGGRLVDRFLRRESVQSIEWIEADDLQALVALVEAGAGCAIVPMTEAVLPMMARVRRVALGPSAPRREIGVVHQLPAGKIETEALASEFVRAASSGSEPVR